MRARQRISTGIYKDKFGIAIIVSVHGQPREFRTNEQGRKYSTYPVETLRAERLRIQAREQLKIERATVARDRFAADVDSFLSTISSKGHRINTKGYMAHWLRAFADHQRNSITELDVQTAFAAIQKGASTKRHIRRALVTFYAVMNGVSGYNPARVLIPPPKPKEDARAIPYPVIERIFAALQPSRARARLKLLAYVGLPQHQIAKLQPSDLRLAQREVIIRPRRKGAGVEGRTLPLSPAGVDALQEFANLNAFGSFQNAQLVRTFRLGATRAKVTLAQDVRPYDLRHSFLTEVYRETGDPFAVSELGLHATLEQTARYAKGAVSERATKAIRAVPRFATMSGRANRPKQSSSVRTQTHSRRRKRAKTKGKPA